MDNLSLDRYALPAVVSVAGMHQLIRFAKQVGAARRKHGVKPPATTGPDEFIRTFRAQANALESYPLSVGALWMGSVFFHPVPASALYTGYLIGRERSFWGFCESTEKRLNGFFFSYQCIMGMMALIIAGGGNRLLRFYLDIDVFKMIVDHVPFLQN